MNTKAQFSIAQSDGGQSMFVRTAETPTITVDDERLAAEQEELARRYHLDSTENLSWAEATKRAALDTAARYSLGYYEGTGGVLKRPRDDYYTRKPWPAGFYTGKKPR